MTHEKTFSTAAALSAATGTLYSRFAEFHACAEFVMQRPIMTHEFGTEYMEAELIRRLAHYDFPERLPGEVWEKHLERVEAQFGAQVVVTVQPEEAESQ